MVAGMDGDIWDRYQVWFTSFWGWSPWNWGCVGFTTENRRRHIVDQTNDPFLMVVYVTGTAPSEWKHLRSKVVGAFLVSHIPGDRDDFTGVEHHDRNPDKWRYSLKAIRAFTFLPEFQLELADLFPDAKTRQSSAQDIGANGIPLGDDLVAKLRKIPYREVPVFDGLPLENGDIVDPRIGKVRAGPQNRSGYTVPGEPIDSPKCLYALQLEGDVSHYLGQPAAGRNIFKIGLSMSPETRRISLQSALPQGTFQWKLLRSTDGADQGLYTFGEAVAGEDAMKGVLAKGGTWLGGEFYAATNAVLDAAWEAGHRAADAKKAG